MKPLSSSMFVWSMLVAAVAIIALGAASSNGRATGESKSSDGVVVVQWNVENLFDAQDDPDNEGDDEFLSTSWRQWSEKHYHAKLRNLADAIAEFDSDILCLQEVENRHVLDDLNRVLKKRHDKEFAFILHREGPDHRGIDVALLSNLEPKNVRWLLPVEEQREILIAEFLVNGHPFTVFVNHWKSQWGDKQRAARLRTKQASAVRREVDMIMQDNPDAPLLIVGDFNDDYTSSVIRTVLRSVGDRDRVLNDKDGNLLFNLHSTIPDDGAGTIFYRRGDSWNSFDSMSVSRAMLPQYRPDDEQRRWTVRAGSFQVVPAPMLRSDDGTPKPYRRVYDRSKGSRVYVQGFSDHFPVQVTLEIQ